VQKHPLFVTTVVEIDPTTFAHASKHAKWKPTIIEEYNALMVYKTFILGSNPLSLELGWKYKDFQS